MEPVTLGIGAAALLASKFGERLANDAGSSTWNAVERLRELIGAELGRDAETNTAITALVDDATPQGWDRLAEQIEASARRDPEFAHEVERLIAGARWDKEIDLFVARAYDCARQVNIRGDNIGTISIA
ncbi:hypothetical protein [Nocardia sp. NPDC005998]|uniref:hypothetical protein n=1 Tax=Nocardia sp. NPDC005998 TaxID=3156894 RepID=UPI0033BD946C